MGGLHKRLIIIMVLASGILLYSFYNFWQKSPENQDLAVNPQPANFSTNTNGAKIGINNEVVIYISGAVNKPGVIKMATGSRIIDAVTIAGGFAPGADATRVNLAQQVKDEMQINVPYVINIVSPTANAAAGNAAFSSGGQVGDRVNINTASKAELDKLPGIGPAIADRIIEYRTTNGPFKDMGDVKKIPGIGDSKYNKIKDKIIL